MTPNAVAIVQGALGPEVLAPICERLGEDPAAIARAVSAGAPAVLQRLIARGREPGGAEALLAAIRSTGAARSLADPLARLQPDGRPDTDLLGADMSGALAAFSGTSLGAAAALLAMLTPLSLGALARLAPTPLNPDTLGRTLSEQSNNVERAMPPGFDPAAEPSDTPAASQPAAAPLVADPMETASAGAVMEGAPVMFPTPGPVPIVQPPARTDAPATPTGQGGLPKWLLPLLAALILLAVLTLALRQAADDEPEPSAPPSAGSAPTPVGSAQPEQ